MYVTKQQDHVDRWVYEWSADGVTIHATITHLDPRTYAIHAVTPQGSFSAVVPSFRVATQFVHLVLAHARSSPLMAG